MTISQKSCGRQKQNQSATRRPGYYDFGCDVWLPSAHNLALFSLLDSSLRCASVNTHERGSNTSTGIGLRRILYDSGIAAEIQAFGHLMSFIKRTQTRQEYADCPCGRSWRRSSMSTWKTNIQCSSITRHFRFHSQSFVRARLSARTSCHQSGFTG